MAYCRKRWPSRLCGPFVPQSRAHLSIITLFGSQSCWQGFLHGSARTSTLMSKWLPLG
jgi:hypothetical protein